MKKQINPTIKAYLIRSAFYLLLLLAVCAIPFALAQSRSRGTAKRSMAKPVAKPNAVAIAQLPQNTSSLDGTVHASRVRAPAATDLAHKGPMANSPTVSSRATGPAFVRTLPATAYPNVVLYDQYDNDLNNGIVSANRTDSPPLSAEAADNFVVPGGETWTVTEVDIRSPAGFPAPSSFAVTFYLDNGSGFPGTQVYTASGLTVVGNPDYIITLTSPAVLGSGTYWVSAVGTISGFNWYWEGRSVTSNTFSTAWRNPGNGYGTGCTDWGVLTNCIGINWPDQMFRIVGTMGGGGACTTYTTTTGSGPIVPGTTDTGSHCDDCTVPITFPFPVSVYGQTFNSANVNSNGNLQFTETIGFLNHGCNPLPVSFLGGPVIFGYWDDLRTDQVSPDCASFPGGCGVFTSTTGTAPNRQFNIEWRTGRFGASGTANFEVVFYEGQSSFFDIFYGATADNGSDETSGVQMDPAGPSTQFSCGAPTLTSGLKVTYTCSAGPSPTPTPTPTGSPTCTPGWQNEPNMLAARAFASGAVANNAFYVLTGFNGSDPYVTETDYFNGTAWATGAPIPVPHSQSKAASIGNIIYVPGGYSFGQINNMQIYDTVANTWSAGLNLPEARSGPAVAALNGKVYIIGGFDASFTNQNQVWEYDPVGNTYTTKTPMPGPAGNVPGAALGNEIFVIGGSPGLGNANFAYNPTTDSWRTITPPSPTDCQAGGLFPLNGQLWLVGCLGQNGTIAKVYDPNSDSWSAGPPLNTSQEGGSATSLYAALGFVAGGGPGGAATTTVEAVGSCGTATPTPTPTASPSCTPGSFQVLIVSSDVGVQPVMLHNQIAAEPGVTTVDYFDAEFSTPTLGQLQPYNIVVAFSNSTYADPVGMGNVLADYADGGGIVVGFMFNWYGPPFDLQGRWQTDGYSPFVDGVGSNFGNNCLGTYDMTHPLMQNISAGSLCSGYWGNLALTPGAVSVAEYQDGQHLCAYQVHNGHTGVGVNAYVGDFADSWTGPFGTVVVNAGRWLLAPPCGTPTPTPTATATFTPTATATATATATFTPTATATATATSTPTATIPPRPTPTPRPRPTPPPRP